MKKHPPAPRKVVVLTLPVSVQNKVLRVLHDVFGISETYNRPQQFIMSPAGYGVFVAQCSLLAEPPTLKQITGSLMALEKVPEQRFVAHISGWNSTLIEDIDHADPAHS